MEPGHLHDDDLDVLLAAVDAAGEAFAQPLDGHHQEEELALCADPDVLLFPEYWSTLEAEEERELLAGPSLPGAVISTAPQPLSATSPPAPTQAYTRVVASRQRAKRELEHLRQRVADLETQLAAARASAAPPPPSEQAPATPADKSVAQFWERLAQTELEARQRAVAENLKLRGMLEAQLRTAKSLARLLCKRPRAGDGLLEPPQSSDALQKRAKQQTTNDARGGVFEMLMDDLDGRYTHVDAVFEDCGLSDRRERWQDSRARQLDGGGGAPTAWCLEFLTSTVVPFDFALTSEVAWRALQSPSIPLVNGVYETVEATHDLVKAVFTVRTKLRGTEVVSDAKFVARRYHEHGRLVVVWALHASLQGGLLKNHHVVLREEGWSSISPLEDSGRGGEWSLTQACGRLRPMMVVRAGSKLDELVGVLTDVLLDCYHDTQQGLYDFTGRMLLEEAATRRRDEALL